MKKKQMEDTMRDLFRLVITEQDIENVTQTLERGVFNGTSDGRTYETTLKRKVLPQLRQDRRELLVRLYGSLRP